MTIEVITFGCRLNSYESEIIRKHADDAGLSNTVIINSCAVTSEAERQLRQVIRKVKNETPDKKIIITGCAAQINSELYASMPEVDRVMGNVEKLKLDYYLDASEGFKEQLGGALPKDKVVVSDIMSIKAIEKQSIAKYHNKAKAYLQVQNGCNHRCTFCIIPYGRGNSRSIPIGEIVEKAQGLVDLGYNEIVLTGVDITDYGLDLPGQPTLGQMIKRLLKLVTNLPRLRLSSIDVAEIDNHILDLIANEPRFMPHLHLSLQSGDALILKRMKRRHNPKQVLEFCSLARSLRPEIAFGADIIAGFPTEDEVMFDNTYKLLIEAEICHLHVFPYSERSGTPASRMPPVPKEIRKSRARQLRQLGQNLLECHYKKKLGKLVNVLIEDNYSGRDEDYSLIKLNIPNSSNPNELNEEIIIGNIVNAKVSDLVDNFLIAEAINKKL